MINIADFNITKNSDGTFKVTVTQVVKQSNDFTLATIDDVTAKVVEVEATE